MTDRMTDPGLRDPRFTAALDLLGRTGARNIEIRHDEPEHEGSPVVWMVVVGWNVDPASRKPVPEAELKGEDGFEVGAALHPLLAALRCCEQVIDGAKCAHCQRPAGFEPESLDTMPLNELVCWYQWDPENETFRRACEGDAGPYQGVGRNDPCPCGSGAKFKKCHGA